MEIKITKKSTKSGGKKNVKMPFIFYSTKSSLHNKKLDFRSTIKKVCLSKNQVSEIYLARVGLKEATFEYLAHDNNLAPTLQLQ